MLRAPLVAALAVAAAVAGADARAAPPQEGAYYYDRLLVDRDLQNSSAGFLRLLRNTIYAKAGRPFKDPTVRAYFEAQAWYRPRPEGATKLSAIDEANLRSIRRWEAKRAEEQVGLFDSKFSELVPRAATADRERAPRADCEADVRGVLVNRKDEDRLVAIAARLRWSGHKTGFGVTHDDVNWNMLDKQERAVRLACLPDLDSDGMPEAVAVIMYPFKQDPEGVGAAHPLSETWELTFLVSGKGPGWRGVGPLAMSGYQVGIEGHHSARVELVKLEDGRWALAVRASIDQCGEEGCGSEELRRFTVRNGKLVQLGRTSRK